MMEDRRRASEDLFGDLMNFQAGPTRGDDADRLRSAIEWMRTEFLNRLQDYLTSQQLAAWGADQTRRQSIIGRIGQIHLHGEVPIAQPRQDDRE